MIRGSPSHVDLTVAALERSVAFYDRLLTELGYRRIDATSGGAPCWGTSDADGGFFSIALVAASPEGAAVRHDRRTPGLHHLAFHADSRRDVDDLHAFLVGMGARILDPPAEYQYTKGYYAVFFADPDGLKLEVVFEPELRGRTGPGTEAGGRR